MPQARTGHLETMMNISAIAPTTPSRALPHFCSVWNSEIMFRTKFKRRKVQRKCDTSSRSAELRICTYDLEARAISIQIAFAITCVDSVNIPISFARQRGHCELVQGSATVFFAVIALLLVANIEMILRF
ncbi:hypothetical protein EV702DRAFT_178309 [Suillus placidus]|uniref:Uncharacterized protein n=1 Tax=Suillus placidus TaxID=48579 RepID=A0A9P6ZYX0_9AGAM|nr:hypothetical protein EV702DRAFT_178309 [Suillus placidus]